MQQIINMRTWIPVFNRPAASLKDRAKLSLGSMVFPAQTRRWHAFVARHPLLGELSARYPRILHKIYRPYVSRHLNCAERVDILIGHYGLIFKAGFGDLVREAAHSPVTLAAFAGKSGVAYRLDMSAIKVGHREGEMSLQLMQGDICLYSVTFVLMHLHGHAYIKLGSLQGLRSPEGPLLIKAATRDLFGCRPKTLMVTMVRSLGEFFGCGRMLLVSNDNRISINRWRRRKITSNYDQTWQEMSAQRRPDGNFELPCRIVEPFDLASIPSNKRSEMRKRVALLEAVEHDLRLCLECKRLPRTQDLN